MTRLCAEKEGFAKKSAREFICRHGYILTCAYCKGMRCMCRHVTCRIDMLHMTFYGMLHTAMYSTDIVHTNMCKQVTHKNLQECRSTCSTYWHVHIYRHVTYRTDMCRQVTTLIFVSMLLTDMYRLITYWHVQTCYILIFPDMFRHVAYWLVCADILHTDICRHVTYWHVQRHMYYCINWAHSSRGKRFEV